MIEQTSRHDRQTEFTTLYIYRCDTYVAYVKYNLYMMQMIPIIHMVKMIQIITYCAKY